MARPVARNRDQLRHLLVEAFSRLHAQEERTVDREGMPLRAVVCLAAYKKLPGLYDLSVLTASLDGHIIVCVGNNEQFQHFCAALKKPEWAEDVRFAHNKSRVANRDVLVPMIQTVLLTGSVAHWQNALHKAGVPCGPVNTMDNVFAMEQVEARQMKIEIEHPVNGSKIPLVGSPLKLSATPVAYDLAPPTLGQHTQEILKEQLGLSQADIDRLADAKVIQAAKI